MQNRISKASLCKLYSLSYKTLAIRLAPIADEIHYKTKNVFSPKEFEKIQLLMGDTRYKSTTKKELKEIMGVSYKILANWLKPVFGVDGYKSKRYFSPEEFKLVTDKLGMPFFLFTNENDIQYIQQLSLLKGRKYDNPKRWG